MPEARSLFADEESNQPAGRFLRVAVERGMDTPAGWSAGDVEGLTYATDDERVVPGMAVTVPLGRGNTPVRGLVIEVGGAELLGELSPSRVKRAETLPDAPLPPSLVELGRWIARYYLCPLGMAFASMVPASVKKGTGARTELRLIKAEHPPQTRLAPSARAAWEAIGRLDESESVFPCTPTALKHALGLRSLAPINMLVKHGFLSSYEADTVRTTEVRALSHTPLPAPTPTAEQQKAVEGIGSTLGSFQTHLLLGVTGSGKTEVYLRLVEQTLMRGQSAIILVPEISLTPQAASRYSARLGRDQVVILHSGLTASQRHAGWRRLAEGTARVVVGARSAVFAPLASVGLIVVDEEHDASYKQDQLPRYHGRDVAIKRAQIERAPVVLGSATPSLESYANALAGRSMLWRLIERVGGATLPSVRVVDMRVDMRTASPEAGRPELIGPTLAKALHETLSEGGQAILLLNRRGFARRIGCIDRRCGWTLGCEHCDASLVWHRTSDLPEGGTMRCHHCLAEQRVPRVCPACAKAVRPLQIGTQRLEQDLANWLELEAGVSLLRLDADAASASGVLLETLERFESGQGRVLLGTQMVAKGLDYPNVRLVGVLDADQALSIPDFRAAERTFQLVAQVAGRAGRGQHPGTVIVQTHEPNAPAITAAAQHDYESFARSELVFRKAAQLPPARRMVRLIARDADHAKAQVAAQGLADAVRRHDPRGEVEVIGPMPCVITRISDQFRFGVELFSASAATLQRVLGETRSERLIKSDRHTAVDVDPVALL